MNEKRKIRKLAELTGWPIYGTSDDEQEFPCFNDLEGELMLRWNDHTWTPFRPLSNLNHAWLVAKAYCQTNGLAFGIQHEIPAWITGTVWNPSRIRLEWDALDQYNPATALSEAVLLAEKARENE